ncbi:MULTISPECIES: hypothetical protein [unclassified Leisingera]|uniref:hypothetical protein n=1 Tax=unclassified Leisingera TaxID=2614906 RepID=UPI001F1A2E4E|nr:MULTISPECIES: hypothetical protein [unclassified Leisingera]MCF6430099.1 hypothetical protein [Leisingera sp. MMG026]
MSILTTYRMALPVACLAVAALVTACGSSTTNKNRELYDGIPFKAKAKPVDKKVNRADFSIEIKGADRSVTGARAAAAHAGTTYCVVNYGSSKIDWAVDPADQDTQLTLTDGKAVFQGTCTP